MKKISLPEERVKTSFTLIELLVVIAIIAILAAILMPALSSARERAKSSQCVSNLKALATATQQYSEANRDLFPVWYGHWESHWCYMMQYGKYFNSGSFSGANYKSMATQISSKQPQGILKCPSARELGVADTLKYSGTHYAINELCYIDARAASNLASGLTRGKAPGRHPSEHMMFTESNHEHAATSDTTKPAACYANGTTFRYFEGVALTGTGESPVSGIQRHQGGMIANTAFWDGHVEPINPSAGKHKITYYYVNTGTRFFRPDK